MCPLKAKLLKFRCILILNRPSYPMNSYKILASTDRPEVQFSKSLSYGIPEMPL